MQHRVWTPSTIKAIFIATRLYYINVAYTCAGAGGGGVNKDDFGFTAGSNREVFYHQSSETCTLVVVDDG